MIVREIAQNPAEVLRHFDWFNDYQDTRLWALRSAPEVIPGLDLGYAQWWEEYTERRRRK